MKSVNVHEAKTRLSKMLREIEQEGVSFLICRNGEPIAQLIPHVKPERGKPHPVLGRFQIDYDPTEELTSEEWGEQP